MLLTPTEQMSVNYKVLEDLEFDIITRLGMDVNERGTVECADRFLRLLDLNKNTEIESLCF